MDKKLESRPKSSTPESEQITDPARIARLLEQLAKRNAPLAVRMPGQQSFYTSCTVAVETPHVLLDELMPATGQELLIKERTLKVACKLDGVDMRFSLTLVRVDEKNNLLTNYMTLPTRLDYRQRRQHYRVHIPMSMQLITIIDYTNANNDHNVLIEGLLHDLSHGGIGLVYPDSNITIEHGDTYECAIKLPETDWLYCTLELRYTKNVGTRGQQFIGACFVNLAPAQSRMIGRCISELEREFIRKHAEY